MLKNKSYCIIPFVLTILLNACSVSKNALVHYYTQNQKVFDSIETSYKHLYSQKPFSIGFSDKSFNYVSVTIITDSIQYIYDFGPDDRQRLKDTLVKYKLSAAGVLKLITQMREVRCTWINSLDYYVNGRQMFMTFLSARAVAINAPFTYKKYYILAYFPEPQYFDDEGRLYASRRKRKLRKINNEVYSKLNDRVCFTISENFR